MPSIDTSGWTRAQAEAWLLMNPAVKVLLDGLMKDEILKNLDGLFHACGGEIGIIGVAKAAGYETGKDSLQTQ